MSDSLMHKVYVRIISANNSGVTIFEEIFKKEGLTSSEIKSDQGNQIMNLNLASEYWIYPFQSKLLLNLFD